MRPIITIGAMMAIAALPVLAQTQSFYTGSNVTGQLKLVRSVNPSVQPAQLRVLAGTFSVFAEKEEKKKINPRLRPPTLLLRSALSGMAGALTAPLMTSLPVIPAAVFGFNGLTHRDQRLANNGNQFSIEPPSPSVASGNGFVLEGVNNAIQVYSVLGPPLLPKVISTNELFGVAPAIDRSTPLPHVEGVYPTDMRVFYDHGVNRWFVLQRAQDNDASGNPLNSSRIFLAVSQTGDPTATYNIYEMDTTNASNPGCPCLSDYPQIGADAYGIYISSNEYNTGFQDFVDASILAISKANLATGVIAPATVRFLLRYMERDEFTIRPAATPPGASYFLASGGVQYFLSTKPGFGSQGSLSLWAMFNTASLGSATPGPTLTKISVPSLSYTFPDIATQRPGPLPYGSTLSPPGMPAYLDGGDIRLLSLSYAGGRLFATVSSRVVNEQGKPLVGGAYFILSPAYRDGVLAGRIVREGYLVASNAHILFPAIAVNAKGKGAIAFTLSGDSYYPSAAFVPIDTISTGSAIQVAAFGAAPQDGFSGYPGGFAAGIARWGDYSTAVAANDGSIWMVTEYVPNAPRTEFANWGTYLWRYVP